VGPRRRAIARAAATAVALGFVLPACGQAAFVAPPDPQFTSGERAAPTAPTTTERAESEQILPEDVEADRDEEPMAVDQMFVVDDAGNAAPNRSGWAAVDGALADRLEGPNHAASVAVMVDGEVVHQAAFGERIPGDPVEIGDRFRIGSISKTITAIVTLQLVDDGVLTLDEPVGHILVEYLGMASYDPDVDAITVRELLSHTAGFPGHQGTFFSNGADSCHDAAVQGLARDVRSGNGYDYANMGYCVLGVLIEAVTGKTYERVVYERLLTPLGISGMRLPGTHDLGPDEVSHHPTPGRNYMETLGAAGAWNATPTDLVTIMDSIDPSTAGWKALSPETMAIMRYRVPGPHTPSGYGLGLINYGADGYGHTGTIEHSHSMVLVQPDGVTWAITVAGDSPSETGRLRTIVRRALASGFPGA
jgi:D-alanyl-D-alanine carboxypeptidase